MSAVCISTSSRAGSVMDGSGMLASRFSASSAPAAIRSRASKGCTCAAANLVMESFTMTCPAPLRNGSPCAIVCWSPVTSATGAWQARATSALMPLSPHSVPFSATREMTDGL